MVDMSVKPIETAYDGCLFRSRTEARWAVFFNAIGVAYEYEKEGYDLDGDWYLPDFYLPEIKTWFEVKGTDPTQHEISLVERLAEKTGEKVFIAAGPPAERSHSITALNVFGEPTPWCQILGDRRDQNVYWIVAFDAFEQEYNYYPLGPGARSNHDRLPCISPAIKDAYQQARSERFEG